MGKERETCMRGFHLQTVVKKCRLGMKERNQQKMPMVKATYSPRWKPVGKIFFLLSGS